MTKNMAFGKRLLHEVLEPGDYFEFPDCTVREFAILPVDGGEDFSYTLHLYDKPPLTMTNVTFSDGGRLDEVYSCPEGVNDSIIIECVSGPIVIFWKR